MTLSHTVRFSEPVGTLKLTACNGALTALDWVDDPSAVEAAEFRGGGDADSQAIAKTVDWLAAYCDPKPGRALPELPPLAPQGTDFQRAVWDALLQVGDGAATTYGGISKSIRRGAPRAVGQAVGRNPIPVIIPCHRVLAGGQRIGGFSGGIERKRALLKHEAIAYRG